MEFCTSNTVSSNPPLPSPRLSFRLSFKMSSYSSAFKATSSEEDGWTRVGRGGSKFSGEAATAFGRAPPRVASRAEFSEDAASAFGRGPRPERSSYRPSSAFGEDASSAFGRRPARGDGRPRSEFDEAAASAFGGDGGRRRTGFDDDASRVFGGGKKPRGDDAPTYSRVSRYGGSAPPVKKQTFDEAFPVLGGGGAAPTPVTAAPETAERLPTLAEKLRKKVEEEAAENERRLKLAEDALTRRATEARERAIFATLGASRIATSHGRYTAGDYEDDAPANYEDDLECGAFGESTEQKPHGGAYVASKYDHDYEGYGEGEDDY